MSDMRFGLRLPAPMVSLPNPQRVNPGALRQSIGNGLRRMTRGNGFITQEVQASNFVTGAPERFRIRTEHNPAGHEVKRTTHRLYGPGVQRHPTTGKIISGWEIAARVDKPVSSRTDALGNTVETFRKRSSNKRHSFEVETIVTRDRRGNEISRVCETITPYKGKLDTDGLYDRFHRYSGAQKTRLPHGGMAVEQHLEDIAYMPGIDLDKVKKVDPRHAWDRITGQKPQMVSADPLMEEAVEAATRDLQGVQQYERVKQSNPLVRHQSVDTGFVSHFNDETLDEVLQQSYGNVAPRKAIIPDNPGEPSVQLAQEGQVSRQNIKYSRTTKTVPTSKEQLARLNQRLRQMPVVRLATAPLALPDALWRLLNSTAAGTLNVAPRVWQFPGYATRGLTRGVRGAGRGMGHGLEGLARAAGTIRRGSVNAASNTLSTANRMMRRAAAGTGQVLTAPVRWTQRLANTVTRRGGGTP